MFYEVIDPRYNVNKIEVDEVGRRWRISHVGGFEYNWGWHDFGFIEVTETDILISGFTQGQFYNNSYQRKLPQTILDGF